MPYSKIKANIAEVLSRGLHRLLVGRGSPRKAMSAGVCRRAQVRQSREPASPASSGLEARPPGVRKRRAPGARGLAARIISTSQGLSDEPAGPQAERGREVLAFVW